ncbi:hypothetical protein Y032_0162g3439 [Ancylostoma ceylanicum]|uniref:Uncharacterized protein n=1 Tax=Ancylostoma ceylanicum TaxID=53326 RepID=A0A016SXQ2_9BILA|nr:hypothetical protein Y032_0162g3439 [Ancylostoma ceylanicum]
MLDIIRTMSSAKRRWCSSRPSTRTPMLSNSNLRMTSSRVAVNSFGDCVALSNPSPDVDGDVVIEWRDPGRKVAIELTKYPDVLSRYTLVAQGFEDCFCLNGVEGFLRVDERETERHLVLSR